MKGHIKRIFQKGMCFIMLLAFSASCVLCAYGADDLKNKPKDIYVVYDSSLSMARKNEYSKSPWYETGYGTEILAALLENEDRLHIYFMKDSKDYYSNHEITNQSNNFHDILNSLEYTKNTHVDGLHKAIREIKEEKDRGKQIYLIIFSDGDFNRKDGKLYKQFDYLDEVEKELGNGSNAEVRLIYVALAKKAEDSVLDSTRTKLFTVKNKSGSNEIFHVLTDLGDWIFDRQKLSFIETGRNDGQKTLSITAELPVKRLIILGQTTNGKQGASLGKDGIALEGNAFKLTKKNEIRGLNRADFLKNNRTGLMNVKISEDNVEQGDSEGVVTIWKGSDGNVAPGEYMVTAPSDMSIDIYVEYDFAHRFILEDSKGNQTILDGDSFCIEGDYVLKTQLMNSMTSQPIDEMAEIYDNLVIELELQNGDEVQQITGREHKITLKEGSLLLSGELQLQGNSPIKVKEDGKVTHRLGTVRLEYRKPQLPLDVDKLDVDKTGKEIPFLCVEEDGNNISELLEDVTTNYVSQKQYGYKLELQTGGWVLYPDRNKPVFPGKDEVTVQFQGKKDGQSIDVSAKCSVEYVANPQKIEMEYAGFNSLNSYRMLFQPFRICPLINGEPLEWKENEEGIITGLTQPHRNQNGNYIPEIVPPRMEFVPDEDSKPYFKEVERSEEGTLEYQLKLNKTKAFPHLWNGGEIKGNLIFSCERYGVTSNYDKELAISFERVGPLLRWTTYLLSAMLICSILGAVIKRLRRTRFYGTSTEAISVVNYGEDLQISDPNLILKKHRLRNCFIFWNSKMTVVVDGLGIDKIVLRREKNGFLRIVNARELRNIKVFEDGELPLNGKILWEDEIRLKVPYMKGAEIIIKKNGVDK